MEFESELDKVIMKIVKFYAEYAIECESDTVFISSMLCPRCGEVHLSGNPILNSTSRISPVDMYFYICFDCALPDKSSFSKEELLEWEIASDNFTF